MKQFNITNYLIQQQLKEEYGGPGPMELPDSHKAGMKVPKGGSCCANCKWWNKEDQVCNNTYYVEWAGTNKIPYAADEYCTNWYEPVEALSEMRVNKPISLSKEQILNYFIDKRPYLLMYLTFYSSPQELYESFNYDSLDDFLIDEWGFYNDGDQLSEDGKEVKKYILSYYTRFKPNEIFFEIFGDGNGTNVTTNVYYKKIEIFYIGDRNYALYCHNY